MLWFAYRALRGSWAELRRQPLPDDVAWGWVAAASATFLLAYLVLIETWRAILSTWETRLGFVPAARIWTVSNLGRYVPGKVWQIAAMGVLAQRAGVSPVAATGSAVLGTAVNIAAGFVVVMATGWRLLELPYAGAPAVAAAIVVTTALGLLVVPWLAPKALRVVERATGSTVIVNVPPRRALAYAVVGNVAGWILYGLAFQLLTRALLGAAPGGLASYIAVYTLSYLVGYLVLPAPAGVGFREASMITLMPAAGLATAAQAAVLAIASRVLLTILDIAPGFAFLGRDTLRSPSRGP
ncbi:MAG: flippase-like domain-containing protein [Gemmatimonadota bacterium]|nr:flippase-like domain-containing protein [Gemmatimonadota bacterium]